MAITSKDLVRREVHYCVSGLVHTLANTYGAPLANRCPDFHPGWQTLADMIEQAVELATPIADYESAAREAGWHAESDGSWFRAATDEEVRQGSANDLRITAIDADEACALDEIEPHEREVYEHWIVSDWLADKLAAKGEKIDKDFAGMTVWARTTTGQAISTDSVIEEITAEINNA